MMINLRLQLLFLRLQRFFKLLDLRIFLPFLRLQVVYLVSELALLLSGTFVFFNTHFNMPVKYLKQTVSFL